MVTLKWSMDLLAESICERLLNRFDAYIIIEGSRGLGKSTLALLLAKKVQTIMRKKGIEGYKFNYRKSLLYTRREVLQFFNKWHVTGIADEMINVGFNRDFHNTEQKDLIKMINMNRDHNNLFLACVPQFKTLDSQLKNLSCMRLTVLRRGVAIIQTPNKTIYSPDKWDERVNEKKERGWLNTKASTTKYHKLTTYRGYVKFRKLTDREEEAYQKIKDKKRNDLAKEKGLEEEQKTPIDIIYEKLLDKKIKNGTILEGMSLANDMKHSSLLYKLRKRLKEEGKSTSLKKYFYDEKETKEAEEVGKVFA